MNDVRERMDHYIGSDELGDIAPEMDEKDRTIRDLKAWYDGAMRLVVIYQKELEDRSRMAAVGYAVIAGLSFFAGAILGAWFW